MTLQQLWSEFRACPGWAQAAAWVVAWPIVAALLLAAGARGAVRHVAAVTVVLVGSTAWFGPMLAPATPPIAASVDVERDAAAAPPARPRATTATRSRSGTSTPTIEPTRRRSAPDGVPSGAQPAVVERIVDGDTIRVRIDSPVRGATLPSGASNRVRLLQVDAPETAGECGASQATAFVRRVIPVGTQVWLQADAEDTDRFERFLRYVWLDDGRLLNRAIVARGYGAAVLFEPNDRHRRRIQGAERTAQQRRRGIWGDLCAVADTTPEPSPSPAQRSVQPASPTAPSRTPEPIPAPQPATPSDCHPSYQPCVPITSDVDCIGGSGNGPEYTGRVIVVGPDEYGLDADSDGVGCEDA